MNVEVEKVYVPSDDLVVREIEGEIIIVPLVAGMGDMDDELFSLNETGRMIWENLNGKTSVEQLIQDLSQSYDAKPETIREDVTGLLNEFLKRGMIVEKKSG